MFTIIKQLARKKVLINGIWLYGLQFANMILPLLTLPYVTRVLGLNMYGIFSIALNMVGYLQVLVEYGFCMSATRDVAVGDDCNLNLKFTTVVYSRILLALFGIGIGLFYVAFSNLEAQLYSSVVVLFLCLIGYCVEMTWLFQGKQEMKFISIISIISRTTSTILILLLVNSEKDLVLYCLLYSVSPFLNGCIGCCWAKYKYSLKFVKISFGDIVRELKSGFYVFTIQLSSRVFSSVGVTFLGLFSTFEEVGALAAIQKIPYIIIMLWSPINQVIFPISSKHFSCSFKEGLVFIHSIKKYVLLIFTIFSISLILSRNYVVEQIFGVEYTSYSYWMIPLILWVIISIDNNFLGIQTLLASRHDKEYGKLFQISVMVTIIVNFILSYFFKGFGAALSPLVSEIIFNVLLRRLIRSILIINA
ncbi:MAG: oligosaccharide flippase family protein [Phascolarctobacterium sp.]|nr:oligosaccharide flippase family protein [Phascolarctobacterium sp.]